MTNSQRVCDNAVETAINGHADAVATFNLKDMREAGARFGFQAQRPGPLVNRIGT